MQIYTFQEVEQNMLYPDLDWTGKVLIHLQIYIYMYIFGMTPFSKGYKNDNFAIKVGYAGFFRKPFCVAVHEH